ncbi:ATP-binding protein [Bacillus benzoevorans]|uniref:histidine kinase n=1 Tax=Bacillus benzoevorans TaxID=1456 RepID=A0A7X0LWH4_9BACI|nr:sensor histidine kinase [Bacillus benzoevorans]MBB6446665.1 two-component system sporulation sensor kinase B [Bacillus benzoevorans]
MNEILINVLILLVVLLITQHLLEVYPKKLSCRHVSIYTFFAGLVAIFFCMTFPFTVNEGFNVDIRIVPFIIAGLYGGPIASVGLYLFIVFYRYLLGIDMGFWGTIINYGLIPFWTLLFYKKFTHSGKSAKLLIASGFVLFNFGFSFYIYHYVFLSNTPFHITLFGAIYKITCIVISILTIERIRTNHQIRRKVIDVEKMEMVSHLSASISHEIRNGLTGAKGFMQLLKENEEDLLKKKYIGIALKELERSETIIRDFLTFAKPAPEKIETINMEHLIEYVIELISPLARMNSIVVNKSLSPFWIYGEKKIIQQAFLNFMKNAIEAMPDGGTLEIGMRKHDDLMEIKIKDTGIGMDQDQMERLGKPYFTTKGQKGTGLGMMVAYRVIEDIKGKISVMSEKGKGTTFTIDLPISAENSEIDTNITHIAL